jgi:hypothetical protein
MKHLSTAALAMSVAVVAAAAIAQTRPPEPAAAATASTDMAATQAPPSRRQSGTVGASPDAAPTPNPQASQVDTSPLPTRTPAASAPLPSSAPAQAGARETAGEGRSSSDPAERRLARRHDRN